MCSPLPLARHAVNPTVHVTSNLDNNVRSALFPTLVSQRNGVSLATTTMTTACPHYAATHEVVTYT
jgi:hypothetical protein